MTRLDYESKRKPGGSRRWGRWWLVFGLLWLSLLSGVYCSLYYAWLSATPSYSTSPGTINLCFVLSLGLVLASLIGLVVWLVMLLR
jgi:hypothetical protein